MTLSQAQLSPSAGEKFVALLKNVIHFLFPVKLKTSIANVYRFLTGVIKLTGKWVSAHEREGFTVFDSFSPALCVYMMCVVTLKITPQL